MRFLTARALFLLPLPFCSALAGPDIKLTAVLDSATKGTTVPGMGVAVIHATKLSALSVRGQRDIGKADPLRSDDQWQIGSNTKPMTATLIVRLVEQRKLSLEAGGDGGSPESLIGVTDRTGFLLYGITNSGGAYGYGTVFELKP